MHWCHIKDRGRNYCPWNGLWIWVFYFMLPVFSILCPSIEWGVCICAHLEAVSWIYCTCVCPSVCLFLRLSVSVMSALWAVCVCDARACVCVCGFACWCCPSLTKGFALYFLNTTESITRRKERNTFQESLTEFYEGLSHWLQLIPTDLDNKYHCLSTHARNLDGRFEEVAFNLCIGCFRRSIHMGQASMSWGAWVHNLGLQLGSSLCCKRWLYGKLKASKVGCYVVLLKVG